MPKATKVGKFRSASKASSRDVRAAPLTSQSNPSSDNKKLGEAHPKNTDDTKNDDEFPSERDDAPLSRGQRKRLAKREQYLKRENMVMSSLRLRRLDDQKGKLDGLDAIREALTTSTTSSSSVSVTKQQQAPNKLMTCNTNKSKRTLANSEISHMGLVLSHPKFNEDPFAAIKLHLQNSLVDDAKKLKVTSEERNVEDSKLVAQKKEERKERIRDAKFTNKMKKKRSYKPARPGARARR
jgi:hypothetical protein